MVERFWLWCLDALFWLGAWRSGDSLRWKLYLWCVERASGAHWAKQETEEPAEITDEEAPF